MPIGAVLVSPEISDVINSQSNKLGEHSICLVARQIILFVCRSAEFFSGTRFLFPWIHLFWASSCVRGGVGSC